MMHHHSPMLRALGMIVWIITAIGALNWGLDALGYNLFNLHFIEANLAHLIMPFKYIFGICGALSIVMFVQHLVNHDDKCC